MGRRSIVERVLWYSMATLCTLGTLGFIRAVALWCEYLTFPTSPNRASGTIYPLNMHGTAVYLTFQQQLRLRQWDFWPWVILEIGAVLFALHKWIYELRKK
ncbi:MAG TPA: hypothetical protein VG028_12175 [Terriglobia bacterium]|nr:hypothetical protein [Terriglobia bacterium]